MTERIIENAIYKKKEYLKIYVSLMKLFDTITVYNIFALHQHFVSNFT